MSVSVLKYKSTDKYVGKDAVDVLVMTDDGVATEAHIDVTVRYEKATLM